MSACCKERVAVCRIISACYISVLVPCFLEQRCSYHFAAFLTPSVPCITVLSLQISIFVKAAFYVQEWEKAFQCVKTLLNENEPHLFIDDIELFYILEHGYAKLGQQEHSEVANFLLLSLQGKKNGDHHFARDMAAKGLEVMLANASAAFAQKSGVPAVRKELCDTGDEEREKVQDRPEGAGAGTGVAAEPQFPPGFPALCQAVVVPRQALKEESGTKAVGRADRAAGEGVVGRLAEGQVHLGEEVVLNVDQSFTHAVSGAKESQSHIESALVLGGGGTGGGGGGSRGEDTGLVLSYAVSEPASEDFRECGQPPSRALGASASAGAHPTEKGKGQRSAIGLPADGEEQVEDGDKDNGGGPSSNQHPHQNLLSMLMGYPVEGGAPTSSDGAAMDALESHFSSVLGGIGTSGAPDSLAVLTETWNPLPVLLCEELSCASEELGDIEAAMGWSRMVVGLKPQYERGAANFLRLMEDYSREAKKKEAERRLLAEKKPGKVEGT